jgi:hypothetical protein
MRATIRFHGIVISLPRQSTFLQSIKHCPRPKVANRRVLSQLEAVGAAFKLAGESVAESSGLSDAMPIRAFNEYDSFDIVVVQNASENLESAIAFFQQVRQRPGLRKGILRILL